MSLRDITVLPRSATVSGLVDDGPVARPVSQPASQTRSLEVHLDGAGTNLTGIWECSPGTFERHLVAAEVMHILCGRGSFTPTGGPTRAFEAGDTVFFPSNTVGMWRIEETVRKVYVVMA